MKTRRAPINPACTAGIMIRLAKELMPKLPEFLRDDFATANRKLGEALEPLQMIEAKEASIQKIRDEISRCLSKRKMQTALDKTHPLSDDDTTTVTTFSLLAKQLDTAIQAKNAASLTVQDTGNTLLQTFTLILNEISKGTDPRSQTSATSGLIKTIDKLKTQTSAIQTNVEHIERGLHLLHPKAFIEVAAKDRMGLSQPSQLRQ